MGLPGTKETGVCTGHTPASLLLWGACSKGILFRLPVIIGLEPALPVIGHSVALFRAIFCRSLRESGMDSSGPGGLGIPLSGAVPVPSQLLYAGYHLNGVHFEIALNSVCCVNPSLDVYFNSVMLPFCKVYRRKSREILDFMEDNDQIYKINIKSTPAEESEKTEEIKR